MQRILTGLIGLMLAGGALAVEVYKCADPFTGNLTISQLPCAPDARREAVNVTRPSDDAIQASQQLWEEIGAQQDVARRQRELARQALREQERLQAEQRALKAQQEALRDASRAAGQPREFVYPDPRWTPRPPHRQHRPDDDRHRPPPAPRESETRGRGINGTAWPSLSIKPVTGGR